MPVIWSSVNIALTLTPRWKKYHRLLPCDGVSPVTLVNHGRKHRWWGCDGKPRLVCQFCGLTKEELRDPLTITLEEALKGD